MGRPKNGYRNASGKRVPGVTTIIGRFKASGGLLHWAFEQGKAAERGEVTGLYDKRDEAADAGKLAHDMVDSYLKFEDPDAMIDHDKYSTEIIRMAMSGFSNFLEWYKHSNLKIKYTETPMVCNEYNYGGTPDGVALTTDGKYAIVDWKTGNGCYPEHLIQMRAYKTMWDENHPDKIISGGFHLVRFSREYADFTHKYWDELEDAWAQFLLFRKAYEIDKILTKRSK